MMMGLILNVRNLFIMLLLVTVGCIDPYQPPEINSNENHLVVDGFLDVSKGASTVKLSRLQNLQDTETPAAESRATVIIKDQSGNTFRLLEQSEGDYFVSGLYLDAGTKCRLEIETKDGKKYISDEILIKNAPEIDSISWKTEDEGVQVYVNSHDPEGNTRYYRWEYEETWQFHARYDSRYEYKNGNIVRRIESIYRCWNTVSSRDINVSSTVKLKEDIISEYPLFYIPGSSPKLREKISILVRQFALSREAYDYYKDLKSNTENLGTLFDPQPFQLTGNIHNINDPEEPVIGYFTSSSVTDKRIFINSGQLPTWRKENPYATCEADSVLNADLPDYIDDYYIIDEIYNMMGMIIGYRMVGTSYCADCRTRGTNIKPEFWE